MVKKLVIALAMFSMVSHGQVFVRTNDVLSLSPTANPMQWTDGYPVRYTTYLRQGSVAVDLSGLYAVWLVSDRRDGLVVRSNAMTTVSATNGCITLEMPAFAYEPGDFYRSSVNVYSDAGVFQYTAAIDNVLLSSISTSYGATNVQINSFITNFSYDTTSRTMTLLGSGGGGAFNVNVTNVTTNYTAVVGNLVLADTSANPITITMPAATNNMGKEISCRIMSSSNLLTIESAAGNTINGESSIGLSIAGNAVDMISDGLTNWWVK